MTRRNRQPRQPERLSEDRINGMDSIFPGFAAWYRANHDEQGRHIGTPMPGLTTPEPTEPIEKDEKPS